MPLLRTIIVLFETINATSLPLLGCILLLLILSSAELGLLIGRRVRAKVADKDANHMATAALGLLALLIAFTYSMSLARYDLRRSLVLQEANAIGSTASFAQMLPAADQAAALPLLRDYAQIRTNLGIPYDEAKLQRDVAQSRALLAELWRVAATRTATDPQSLPTYRYVAALNETRNVAEARLTALRNHVPVEILLMLVGTAMVAMGFVGYSGGVAGYDRQVALLIMSSLLAFLIVVTQDLARPDRGFIEVPTQALQDTLAQLPQAAPVP